MVEEKPCQIVRRADAHLQCGVKFVPPAVVNAQKGGRRVVDEKIHPAILRKHFLRKPAQCFFLANVTGEIGVLCAVDDANRGPGLCKFFADAFANAPGPAGDNGHFARKHRVPSSCPLGAATPRIFCSATLYCHGGQKSNYITRVNQSHRAK
ncbi:hypothetical protein SDC9_148721 [bioreactor metagenome]|uniref:Uncharacterized protein n=1 Tax=bioreactor metagenome TaxID=1076179 RepID=A0A645EJQ4_9ZZZZ